MRDKFLFIWGKSDSPARNLTCIVAVVGIVCGPKLIMTPVERAKGCKMRIFPFTGAVVSYSSFSTVQKQGANRFEEYNSFLEMHGWKMIVSLTVLSSTDASNIFAVSEWKIYHFFAVFDFKLTFYHNVATTSFFSVILCKFQSNNEKILNFFVFRITIVFEKLWKVADLYKR